MWESGYSDFPLCQTSMEGDRMNTPSSDGISDGVRRTRTSLGRTSGPTRRSTKGQWTLKEDEILHQAVQRFKGKNWKKIAECFKDRTDVQCLHRWQKVLNPELVKGPWSKEEDEIIIQLVNKFGPKKWSTISQHLPGRIGKQCRERWHNHLNPGINKQAWTQEEELALIRAHQIYGNKWAELTKFLPGRTDNSIKNHWNSSVKKKLDQYLASGLLQQFQGLPHVSHPCQSNASSSLRIQQSSEDDNVPKDGAEVEEVSQCSQGSAIFGCSQSTSDMGNTVVHTIDDCRIAEESCNEKDSSSSPSCSGKYLTAFQEFALPISEVTHELGGSSMFIESSFTNALGTSMANDWQINHNELPKPTSQDLGQESLGHYMQCLNGNESHQTAPFVLPNSMHRSTRCFPFGIDVSAVDGFADHLLFQSSNSQIRENGTFASQPCYLSSTEMLATSNFEQSSAPPQLPISDGALIFVFDPNQSNYSFVGNQEQESLPDRHDDFICGNESESSLCDNGMKKEMAEANDAPKLVAVNDICSVPSREVQTSVDTNSVVHDNQKDSGALCYDPPRFPTLDIPFLSCDLLQSGSDMLQEYSPLGTRQFWTSFNRLWDSPSGDKSPDAVLKSAAKCYTRTPSILKKRNRDLVSPLSEKRSEKKFESTFSNLSREFSRLDVMFDEVANDKVSNLSQLSTESKTSEDFTEDKENINPDLVPGKMVDPKGAKGTTFSDSKVLSNEVDISAPHGEYKGNNCKTEGEGDDEAAAVVNQPTGTCIEHDKNSHSRDPFGIRSDRTIGTSVKAHVNQYSKRMEAESIATSSSETPCLPVCSPRMSEKDENNLVVTRSVQSSSSSTPVVTKVALTRNGAGVENICIFGETPYRRSFESPSAWKSPWFMNSFLLGSRGDGDVTIEDYGHFLSPGSRSYDAIGLTKLLSEQTASAYANAQEVLGDETPQTLLKKKYSKNQKEGESNEILISQPEEHSSLASSVVAERRILDFSDCETPGKGIEAGKSSNAISFCSPSSSLFKDCR